MDFINQQILGVKINPLTYPKTLQIIKNWITNKQRKYICVAAVHLIMECQENGQLLNGVNNSGLTVPDGMPLVWLLNKTENRTQRIYGPELMLKICNLAQDQKWKILILGGSIKQSKKLKQILIIKYPRIQIVGNIDTPIRPIPENKNTKIIQQINSLKPNIIFIGMGCPYQEKWMIENISKLDTNVLIGVGAAFDFITGIEKQAPSIIQSIGLEWLWRLFQKPKRLWYRYSVINILFIYRLIKELFLKLVMKVKLFKNSLSINNNKQANVRNSNLSNHKNRNITVKRILYILLLIVGGLSIIYIYSWFNFNQQNKNLNVLLITIDSLRRDHVGAYGYEKPTTSNIDKLSNGAFIFTNAFSTIPLTVPSMSSLFTGLHTYRLNISKRDDGVRISYNTTTLAQTLQKYGYITGALVTMPSLNKEYTNIDQGFDIYLEKWAWHYKDEEYNNISNYFENFIKETNQQKFFFWIHLSDPHAPYDPRPELRCKFNPNICNYISNKTSEEIEKTRKAYESTCNPGAVDQNFLEAMLSLYDGDVAAADEVVGQILDKLKQYNLDDKTVIILSSDHGEAFEHNYFFGKGVSLYNSTTKIPLIIKHPLLKNNGLPVLVNKLTENSDFMPTILDLLELDRKNLLTDGVSYVDAFSKYYLLNQISNLNYPSERHIIYFWDMFKDKFAINTNNYKYIYSHTMCLNNDHQEELYNLQSDPGEIHNLVESNKDISAELKKRLFQHLALYNLPQATQSGENVIIPEDTLEKIKSLGY